MGRSTQAALGKWRDFAMVRPETARYCLAVLWLNLLILLGVPGTAFLLTGRSWLGVITFNGIVWLAVLAPWPLGWLAWSLTALLNYACLPFAMAHPALRKATPHHRRSR